MRYPPSSNSGASQTSLRTAIHLINQARKTLVLTGAGVSAESGVPTFRGTTGLWRSFPAEELATPEAFQRDPRLCWEWYAWRRDLLHACLPNPAHHALARWLLAGSGRTLVTQNVDGLHEAAAMTAAGAQDPTPAMPVRLHGSIFRVRCPSCATSVDHRDPVDVSSIDALPRCQGCRGILRPDVVWFGEPLPERELALATEAATTADLCLVIGTRGAVYPAAGLVFQAKDQRATVVVIDPAETEFDALADVRMWGSAGELVPQVLEVL
jgi:NAD-dependent deacetylase